MIEKKISYEINIEKPSKTKPVKQGGVLNYLGKQKTVNAPVRWRSSKDHPIAKLAYITKDEEKILIDLNLYGSLKGKPNRGPFGLPSLQGSGSGSGGDGGSSGGDSGGPGDSGPGGSDDGSGHGGPGQGDSGPGGSDDGTGHGGPGPGPGGAESGFGIGPDAAAEAEASNAAAAAAAAAEAEVDMSMPAMQTVSEKAMSQVANTFSVAGMIGGLMGMMSGVPGGFSIGSNIGSSIGRGVTGPSDDTQETSSVQSGPSQSPSDGGGIATIQAYAPLYNSDTGNPTMDAYIRQLRVNLGLPV
jgi:hypothetical protein